jgi:TonB family protein
MKGCLIAAAVVLLSLGSRGAPLPDEILPARLVTGSVTPLPAMMLGGAEVFVELSVDMGGRVTGATTLRATPPLTALLNEAVRGWRFTPSQRRGQYKTEELARKPYSFERNSKVLVGAIYRPPSVLVPTFGSVPTDAATPDPETPFPVRVETPSFPLAAFAGGVVLVEIALDGAGNVGETRVLESAPPFDALALDAARHCRFRPSVVENLPTRAYVYLLFGFPLPVTEAADRHLDPLHVRYPLRIGRALTREFP